VVRLRLALAISRAALQAVQPNVPISITAENAITFDNLSAHLALQTAAGSSAQFVALNGSITFTDTTDTLSTAGGRLTLLRPRGRLQTAEGPTSEPALRC
jgi:hypothetical protein